MNNPITTQSDGPSVEKIDHVLTREDLQVVLPKDLRSKVSDTVLNEINEVLTDPMLRDSFKENLVSYTGALTTGKYSINEYINAVKFVSYKLMGCNVIESYIKTFPDRYKRLLSEGANNQLIGSYASQFNKTQLVNKIFEQTLIPTHILNADVYQKAINVQAELMVNAKSEKVRTDAANSLLNHLKRPEASKIELNINTKEDSSIKDLRAATMELAAYQRAQIKSGMSNAQEIAHSKIIEIATEDV